jgi:hypothetical protein
MRIVINIQNHFRHFYVNCKNFTIDCKILGFLDHNFGTTWPNQASDTFVTIETIAIL